MRRRTASSLIAGMLVCAGLLAGTQRAAAGPQEPAAVAEAAAVRAFTHRVEQYVALRGRLEEPLPGFDARRDPWSLMLTRRYLASAIRTARSRASVGDVFTRDVAPLFRAAIARAVAETDVEGLMNVGLAPGEFAVDLVINEPVPAWAMAAAPPALLARLPRLPDNVEYRLVNGTLVLWDAHAELLIDALPDAFGTPES